MRISTAVPGSRGRRLLTVVVMISSVLATVVVDAPAAAAGPPPGPGQHKLVKKSVKISVSQQDLRTMASQAKARRADGKVVSMSPQDDPFCDAGSTDGTHVWPDSPPSWDISLEWWYDVQTRVTQTAFAAWGAETWCNDMNFISMSSTLRFRNAPVDAGTYGACGTTANDDDNHCGLVASDGAWPCGGIGNCNGDYYAEFGWAWILPAGWEWISLPTSCAALSSREASCYWTTPTYWIPFAN